MFVVKFDALAQAIYDIRIRTQVSVKPILQQTECPLTN